MRRVLMLIEAGGRRRAVEQERMALAVSLGRNAEPKKIPGMIVSELPPAVHHDPYAVDVKPLGQSAKPQGDGEFDDTPWWGTEE